MTPATREEVTFHSGGEVIRAWFDRVGSPTDPVPAMVLCPGFTGTKYAAFYVPYVEHLVAAGCSVLSIDYRGWGDSDGERGVISPSRQVEDILSALAYLRTRSDVDGSRCGLLGMSFGGGNVVQAAAMDERVSCCISVSPVGDGGLWLRQMRREYEWYELLDRIEEDRRHRAAGQPGAMVDPVEDILVQTPERRATRVKGSVPADKVPRATPLWCAGEIRFFRPWMAAGDVAPAGLLLFAVEQDSVVPPSHSEAIFSSAQEPKRLVMLPGREHYGTYLGQFERIWAEIAQWTGIHLQLDIPR